MNLGVGGIVCFYFKEGISLFIWGIILGYKSLLLRGLGLGDG